MSYAFTCCRSKVHETYLISLVCTDGLTFTTLDVFEEDTQTQPSYIDVSGETFTLNIANWLLEKPETVNLNAFRNHAGVSKFKVQKDYSLIMKYCQISDIVLP